MRRQTLFLLLIVFASSWAWGDSDRSTDPVGYYLERYGKLEPDDDATVGMAHRIFARLIRVADLNRKKMPRLAVVNSDSAPWAIALPDGYIVLSARALLTCRSPMIHTEACVAFVIGHELAHLAHDDFLHRDYHALMRREKPAKHMPTLDAAREYAADDKGFIYAAMAGFPVEKLLNTSERVSPFFVEWMRQTRNQSRPARESAETRTSLLHNRLTSVRDKLSLFRAAVRLAHFDYCDDAIVLLRQFQRVYAGREVLSNLGFCYLQRARQRIKPENASFYWYPLLLDNESRSLGGTQRTDSRQLTLAAAMASETDARDDIREAIRYLEIAHKADPDYLPAIKNLASAYMYDSRPHRARELLKAALTRWPNDPDAAMLEAIAIHEQSVDHRNSDLSTEAISRLRVLTEREYTAPAVYFNLARIAGLIGNRSMASAHWQKLAPYIDQIPQPLVDVACSNAVLRDHPACQQPANPVSPVPRWDWPLETAGLQELSPAMEKMLKGWRTIDIESYDDGLEGRLLSDPINSAQVLELNGYLQMQSIDASRMKSSLPDELPCARPLYRRKIASGELLSCGNWAVLQQDDEVREAWWIASLTRF